MKKTIYKIFTPQEVDKVLAEETLIAHGISYAGIVRTSTMIMVSNGGRGEAVQYRIQVTLDTDTITH